MPCSEAQLVANRQNAQKSTGPRSPEGKAISSRNAVDHGLCSDAECLPGDDPQAAAQRRYDWYCSLKPKNQVEKDLVDLALEGLAGVYRCEEAEQSLIL